MDNIGQKRSSEKKKKICAKNGCGKCIQKTWLSLIIEEIPHAIMPK